MSLLSPKFQDVDHLEYQVDPAHAEADKGALCEVKVEAKRNFKAGITN